MKRRALLASAGSSLAALSGCLFFSGEEDRQTHTATATPNETTPTATPSPTTPTPEVTVESATQQHGFVAPNDDAIYVTDAETHYLLVEVTVEAGFYERGEFTLTAGSAGIQPTQIRSFYRTDWGDDQWYEQGRERGLLLFELPDELGSGPPRLRWPSGEWQPGKDLVRRLTTPRPPMTASLSVPDASDGSTEKTVEVEVANEGENEGRYLGAVNRVGPTIAYTPVELISTLVGAGETTTVEISDSWSEYPSEEDRGDGERDVTYHLDDADGGDKLELAISE